MFAIVFIIIVVIIVAAIHSDGSGAKNSGEITKSAPYNYKSGSYDGVYHDFYRDAEKEDREAFINRDFMDERNSCLEQVYYDAVDGDSESIEIMRDEYGDDWE